MDKIYNMLEHVEHRVYLSMPAVYLEQFRDHLERLAADGKKVVIGSYHFVFEDKGCIIPKGLEEQFECLPEGYSHLYLAIEGQLAAVICIEDPLREEAAAVVAALRKAGLTRS